ncbi:transposase [Bifidobacterium bifidum LMG 13195]|nr:integrase catalytic subunit [Bifidobacterium bifidum LMG 13195]KLN77043.1 transposase [Bifidobacterium bifidum LMG 13195]
MSGLESVVFSDEDRRRAVDLYFTQGMTIRKVVARLGYPSEGALVNWVRSDPRYERAGKRSYTLECKVRAARRALAGESPTAVARDVDAGPRACASGRACTKARARWD